MPTFSGATSTSILELPVKSDAAPVAMMSTVCKYAPNCVGDLGNADGTYPITTPLSTITSAYTAIFGKKGKAGTTVVGRLRYPAGMTITTAPVGQLFGRVAATGSADTPGEWELLRTISGSETATFPQSTSDVSDGTSKVTVANQSTQAWDTNGNDEFVWGKTTAMVGSGVSVTAANCNLEFKII